MLSFLPHCTLFGSISPRPEDTLPCAPSCSQTCAFQMPGVRPRRLSTARFAVRQRLLLPQWRCTPKILWPPVVLLSQTTLIGLLPAACLQPTGERGLGHRCRCWRSFRSSFDRSWMFPDGSNGRRDGVVVFESQVCSFILLVMCVHSHLKLVKALKQQEKGGH